VLLWFHFLEKAVLNRYEFKSGDQIISTFMEKNKPFRTFTIVFEKK